MSEYTDKNIPIVCAECPGEYTEEGVQAMFEHILDAHPEYSRYEADAYALKWMDAAYDREDEREWKAVRYHQGFRV